MPDFFLRAVSYPEETAPRVRPTRRTPAAAAGETTTDTPQAERTVPPTTVIATGETSTESPPAGRSASASPSTTNEENRGTPEPTVGVRVRCANCHRTGHVGARCPFGDNRVCGHCCRLGHVERDCPNELDPPPTEAEARILRLKNEDEILRRISRREATFDDLTRARARHYNM